LPAEEGSKVAFQQHCEILPRRALLDAVEEMRNSHDCWTQMRPIISYRRTGPAFDSSLLNSPNVREKCTYLPRGFASIATLPDLDFVLKEDCSKRDFTPPKLPETRAIPSICPLYGVDLRRFVHIEDRKGVENAVAVSSSFFVKKSLLHAVQDKLSDGNFPTNRTISLLRIGILKSLEVFLSEITPVLGKFQSCPPRVLSLPPMLQLSKTRANEQVRVT